MPRVADRPRTQFIGSSEAGTLLGYDPYSSRFDLWARKTGRMPELNEDDHPQLRRGKVLEPIVRQQELPRRSDVIAVEDPEDGEFYVDDQGALGSHPDGRIQLVSPPNMALEGWGRLEIKTVNREVFSIIQEQGLPATNVIQLNTTIGLAGDPHGAFAVHCADSWETLLFPMPFAEDLFSHTVMEARKFKRDHILADVAPNPFPDEAGPEVPVLGRELVIVENDDEWDEMMEAYATYRETSRALEELYKGAKAVGDQDPSDPALAGLAKRIQAKMIALGTEAAAGAGWKMYYRPGATRKLFKRELVTKMGPFDPEIVVRVLEDELKPLFLTGSMTGGMIQQIMGRLGLEARVSGEDPRFFHESTVPYFQGFPLKGETA